MKLISIPQSELPCRAGKAALSFIGPREEPRREEETIFLPLGPGAEFYPLKGGLQFLYHIPLGGNIPSARPYDVFFGGEDEDVFLVPLSAEALRHFKEKGEKGFFEALKPSTIRRMEEFWGREKTKRQGDIFAYPLPCSWPSFLLKNRVWVAASTRFYRYHQLFGTQHRVNGLLLLWNSERLFRSAALVSKKPSFALYGRAIGSGRIEAHGHAPLVLKGPHLLEQTDLIAKACGDG